MESVVEEQSGSLERDLLSEEELQQMEEQLSLIQVPDLSPEAEPDSFPPSYSSNSPKERHLLGLADNFLRQYSHLYPDRKPLLLAPPNECRLEKFVCTTLRPTLLPFPELQSWEESARLVSDIISMEPLPHPTLLPARLFSSSTVLQRQRGNCFDFSVLLCSLLLGGGYDAYCVSGYASRELCLMDRTRQECPALRTSPERDGAPPSKPPRKYSVRPPRQLLSRFQQQQEDKQRAKIQNQRLREEEEQQRQEAGEAGPDPLYGRRVHCWVLVLSGKREVPENFFIDALTGSAYSTREAHFLGIESLWNHQNYWVNMQDCRHGCQDLTFDLGDPVCWEFMLLGTSKPLLLTPDMEDEHPEEEEEEDQESSELFQMPPSWTQPIIITPKEFELRCPRGKKLLEYRKSRLEKWAPYLQRDGQVARLTRFQDTEGFIQTEVQDWFQQRGDGLQMRRQDKGAGLITEYFSPGRSDALRVHTYRSMAPETERSMLFYSAARLDGLERREEKPGEISETFRERDDFLRYRHTAYGKRPKRVAIAGGPTQTHPRPILRITERFRRNPEKPANQDVAERVFLVTENRINVRCHLQADRITTSSRELQKPPNLGERGSHVQLTPDTCISYQVEASERGETQLSIYQTLLQLQQDELSAKAAVRKGEAEVLEILSTRAQEESDPQLKTSIYDPERNERSKEQREALERLAQEERQRRAVMELDYLAPVLARLGDPERLSRLQALQVKEESLSELKQRLIQKANLIQARFEKETQELQRKQQWYQQNQLTMSKEDEDTYLQYCSQAMFRIQILENRLNRHKELAPQMYLALEDRLNKDPRLCEALMSS